MENKEFVPYEESLALKELVFEEECFGEYWKRDDGEIFLMKGQELLDFKFQKEETNNVDDMEFMCKAPLYQQALRRFREKYIILGRVQNLNSHTTEHQFYAVITEPVTRSSYEIFDTYEEAEIDCIRKLIETVKKLDK